MQRSARPQPWLAARAVPAEAPAQAARLHVRHVVAARAARGSGVRAARRAARARAAAAAAAAEPPPPVLVVVAVRARVGCRVVVGRIGLLTCPARGAQSHPHARPSLQPDLPAVCARALPCQAALQGGCFAVRLTFLR